MLKLTSFVFFLLFALALNAAAGASATNVIHSLLAKIEPAGICFWCSSDWNRLDDHLKNRGIDNAVLRGRVIDVLKQRAEGFSRLQGEVSKAGAALSAMDDSISRIGLASDVLRLANPAGAAEFERISRRKSELEQELERYSVGVLNEIEQVSGENGWGEGALLPKLAQ